MIAAGIDLGGTKIEAQLFDADWQLVNRRRIATPKDYEALVAAMAEQIAWTQSTAGQAVPIGISAAGLIHPGTGLALTSNLSASGKPFPADIEKLTGMPVTFFNDCRALTLSEAVFGAARGRSPAVGLILGTGVGGGVAFDGRLAEGATGVAEIGHFALAAAPVVAHGLPLLRCGCGRVGCNETLIAGPGLTRLALHLTGRALSPPEIGALRGSDAEVNRVWAVWLELLAELVKTLVMVVDPACIVLGGGVSKIPGLTEDLGLALARIGLPGFDLPQLLLAEGGDASGARGAAYAAVQARTGINPAR